MFVGVWRLHIRLRHPMHAFTRGEEEEAGSSLRLKRGRHLFAQLFDDLIFVMNLQQLCIHQQENPGQEQTKRWCCCLAGLTVV